MNSQSCNSNKKNAMAPKLWPTLTTENPGLIKNQINCQSCNSNKKIAMAQKSWPTLTRQKSWAQQSPTVKLAILSCQNSKTPLLKLTTLFCKKSQNAITQFLGSTISNCYSCNSLMPKIQNAITQTQNVDHGQLKQETSLGSKDIFFQRVKDETKGMYLILESDRTKR